MGYCLNILQLGACHNPGCSELHEFGAFCAICNRVFRSQNGLSKHRVGSQEHNDFLSKNGPVFPCEVCAVVIRGSEQHWLHHLQDVQHLRQVQRFRRNPVAPPDATPGVRLTPRCLACNFQGNASQIQRHLESDAHKDRMLCYLEFMAPSNYVSSSADPDSSAQIPAPEPPEDLQWDDLIEFEDSIHSFPEVPALSSEPNHLPVRVKGVRPGVRLLGGRIYGPLESNVSLTIPNSARKPLPTESFTELTLTLASGAPIGHHRSVLCVVVQYIPTRQKVRTPRRRIEATVVNNIAYQPPIAATPHQPAAPATSRRGRAAAAPAASYQPTTTATSHQITTTTTSRQTTHQQDALVVTEPVKGPKPSSVTSIKYKVPLKTYAFDRSLICEGTAEVKLQGTAALLPPNLETGSYSRFWTVLLHNEEYQMMKDLETYDLHQSILYKDPKNKKGRLLWLDIPGLAEKRPSVLQGDVIHVRLANGPNTWYEGNVFEIQVKRVGLKFNQSFHYPEGTPIQAKFSMNRVPIKRMHCALDQETLPARLLFPAPEHVPLRNPRSATGPQIDLFNQNLRTNAHQLAAVRAILSQVPGSIPYIIFGPPGTGKTATVVEAMLQVLTKDPNARILACAPSNSAADVIAERLLKASNLLGPTSLFRLNGPSRVYSKLPESLQQVVFTASNEGKTFAVPKIGVLKSYRVVVSTYNSSSILMGVGVNQGHFSHVFLDEAGQATEPETMIPVMTMSDKRTCVVVAGDHKQLGPIVRSGPARVLGLSRSYLERLVTLDVYKEDLRERTCRTIVKLVQNYRSHEAILAFSNRQFYDNELAVCGDRNVINAFLDAPVLQNPRFPVIFEAVEGLDEREPRSPSYYNFDEAATVVNYVHRILADSAEQLTEDDIGVIAPYAGQYRKIQGLTKEVGYDGIKVGSVEEFQGQERKVIIISTVRTDWNQVAKDLKHVLGFLVNPRRMNVAFTRAKSLLVVIGDARVLSLDPLWRTFLNYVYKSGGWKGAEPTWDPNEEVQLGSDMDGNPSDGHPDSGRYLRLRNERLFTSRSEMDKIEGQVMDTVLAQNQVQEEDVDSEDGNEQTAEEPIIPMNAEPTWVLPE